MASALMGTLALLPVDRVLRRHAVPYERWVDDVDGVFRGETQFEAVVHDVEEVLAANGQGLNPEKTWFRAGRRTASLDDEADEIDQEPSVEALRDACDEGDAPRCRFVLGGFKARVDDRAVDFIASTDALWCLVPKYSADYLTTVRASMTDGHLERVARRCMEAPSDVTAAGIAHGARVLGLRRVPASLGQALHEAADHACTGRYRGVSPTLCRASSISREKSRLRHERSIDTTAALDDVNSQRALVSGLRVDSRSRRANRGLAMLDRSKPELAPTLAWVIAA